MMKDEPNLPFSGEITEMEKERVQEAGTRARGRKKRPEFWRSPPMRTWQAAGAGGGLLGGLFFFLLS